MLDESRWQGVELIDGLFHLELAVARGRVSLLGPDGMVAQQAFFFAVVAVLTYGQVKRHIAPDVRVLAKGSTPLAVGGLIFELFQALHEGPGVHEAYGILNGPKVRVAVLDDSQSSLH